MRIGIDIDDTITNSWEYIKPFYAKEFSLTKEHLDTCGPYYNSVSHLLSKEEYLKKAIKINDQVILNLPIRKDASKYINRLKKEGNTIVIITARGYQENSEPYISSEKYLKSHHIYYDKLIVASTDKATTCQEEKIDIMVDDSMSKIEDIKQVGIKTILFNTSCNQEYEGTIRANTWKEVYDIIKRM